MTPTLLTVKQLSEMWNLSVSSVHGLMKRKNDPLPYYRLGGLRIDKNEAEKWLESQRVN